MISLILKWLGVANSMNVQGFLDTVEGVVRLWNWLDADMAQAVTMKLADTARTFYSRCMKLHNPGITWVHFKNIFEDWFWDVHTDQYHFLQLQMARQNWEEIPQEFEDRRGALCQKTISFSSGLQI